MYGYGIGEKVLPDVRSLNEAVRYWLRYTEKAIDPPLLMERDNLWGDANFEAGGVTYVRDMDKWQFWNAPTGQFQIADINLEELRGRIRQAFFWDQLDLPPVDAPGNMTAYEVSKRIERAQQLFGPMLGRIYQEVLNPMIQRQFNMMYRKGAFPPQPDGLENSNIDVEYDSPLARAQKMGEVDMLDRYAADLLAVVEIRPEMMDLLDWDEAARLKAKRMGIPENLINGKDKVQQMRDDRAAAQQQAQMLEQAQGEAQVAKDLSQADPAKLQAIMGGV
jgi:hypothetical protein